MRFPQLSPACAARRGAVLTVALSVAVLTVTACEMTSVPLTQPPAALLGGALSVAGPRGYCVDQQATRETGDTAVVLLGRCRGALAVAPALLTVSVGPAASAGVLAAGGPALSTYFTSAQGRAALSRSGRARDVTVIQALGAGDAFLLHLRDRAVGDYWRAVVGVNGRLVTVSANGATGAPLPAESGRTLVDATLAALRRVN